MFMSKPIFSNNDIFRQLSCDTLVLAAGQPALSSDGLGKRKHKKIQKTRSTLHERTAISSATSVYTWRWGTTATFDNSRPAGVLDAGREAPWLEPYVSKTKQEKTAPANPTSRHTGAAHTACIYYYCSSRLLDKEVSQVEQLGGEPARDECALLSTTPTRRCGFQILDIPHPHPRPSQVFPKSSEAWLGRERLLKNLQTPRHGWPDRTVQVKPTTAKKGSTGATGTPIPKRHGESRGNAFFPKGRTQGLNGRRAIQPQGVAAHSRGKKNLQEKQLTQFNRDKHQTKQQTHHSLGLNSLPPRAPSTPANIKLQALPAQEDMAAAVGLLGGGCRDRLRSGCLYRGFHSLGRLGSFFRGNRLCIWAG